MNTLVYLSFLFPSLFSNFTPPDWGFYAHRKINRMAVFTLPSDMIGFYKKNIEYLSEHAIDPDKRKFATKHEAVRHYIDIDQWGSFPFDNVPRERVEALMKFTEIDLVWNGDTIPLYQPAQWEGDSLVFRWLESDEIIFEQRVDHKTYRRFFTREILPQYYEDMPWEIRLDSLFVLPAKVKDAKVIARDKFSSFGILPYYLVQMKNKLTQAFLEKDKRKILRLSAYFGHYIGDAHVPLHTTLNYNGELTDQVGIHAFWESRLPELFAEKEYDFFVGKADYVDDVQSYFWDIILSSHQDVYIVLEKEKELRARYPKDEQFCFDERLDVTQYLACEEFARAFHESLDGMVERRMKASIKAIGDMWFTCWVDAGQPGLI